MLKQFQKFWEKLGWWKKSVPTLPTGQAGGRQEGK